MKITNHLNLDKLDKNYNYIVLENGKPTFFILYEHKTKKTYPKQKLTTPNKLVDILTQYIKSNDMVQGDYLFGVKNSDFKIHVAQSNFTKMIQRIFKLYMGKKISVDLLRSSLSTYADSQNLSLGERKQIATDMGHQLSTHLHYSKKQGVKRLEAAAAATTPKTPKKKVDQTPTPAPTEGIRRSTRNKNV